MKHFYTTIYLCTLVFALVACDELSTSDPLPEGTAPNPAVKRELIPTPPVAEEEAERQSTPGLSYVLPQGWSVGPSKPMRALTLLPGEGFEGVELAVSHWPRGVGGFASNIGRWCTQIGLPLPAADFSSPSASGYEQYGVDDATATYLPLVNKQGDEAILAMWVPRSGAEVWTFKLKCTAAQALKLEDPFKAWASSVQFDSSD